MNRSSRSIRLVNVGPEVRSILELCRLDTCRRCTDGFSEFRGQHAVICECSYQLFKEACQFHYDETERRKAFLPPRLMTVKDRKLVIVDAPSEEALDVPSEKLKLEFEAEALV